MAVRPRQDKGAVWAINQSSLDSAESCKAGMLRAPAHSCSHKPLPSFPLTHYDTVLSWWAWLQQRWQSFSQARPSYYTLGFPGEPNQTEERHDPASIRGWGGGGSVFYIYRFHCKCVSTQRTRPKKKINLEISSGKWFSWLLVLSTPGAPLEIRLLS